MPANFGGAASPDAAPPRKRELKDRHIVMIADNTFQCKHCGATYVPRLPLKVPDFLRESKAFQRTHESCPKPSEPPPVHTVAVTEAWQIWFRRPGQKEWYQSDLFRQKLGDGTAAYAKGFSSRETAEQHVWGLRETDKDCEIQIRKVRVQAEITTYPADKTETYEEIALRVEARAEARRNAEKEQSDAEADV